MWNDVTTDRYEGMIAETVGLNGAGGDTIRAYWSRPITVEKYPTLVLIPHMPGWDEFCREAARRFTHHGYGVICPDIYSRFGTGRPEEVSACMREAGGVSDESVMGDVKACLSFLANQPLSNGKTGVIGMCSGGRHAYLAACTVPGFSACADLWGGRIVAGPDQLTENQPVAPIDYTEKLSCPVIGIFGNEDRSPSPDDVNRLEEALKEHGKEYRFYRYDGAGHGIWYYHNRMYRQEQAMDSWEKVFDFFEEKLR